MYLSLLKYRNQFGLQKREWMYLLYAVGLLSTCSITSWEPHNSHKPEVRPESPLRNSPIPDYWNQEAIF